MGAEAPHEHAYAAHKVLILLVLYLVYNDHQSRKPTKEESEVDQWV